MEQDVEPDEYAPVPLSVRLGRLTPWGWVAFGFTCGLLGMTCCGGLSYILLAVLLGGLSGTE